MSLKSSKNDKKSTQKIQSDSLKSQDSRNRTFNLNSQETVNNSQQNTLTYSDFDH